jgi:Zn-dependent peptidase ImmA (M78 family)/transcriptional regulator with XRE-family HTH domain
MLKKSPSSSGSATRNLGLAIKQRRNEIGITQGDLAVGVGFSAPQTVSDIERGEREVKAWELVKIARALRTSPDDLLGLETVSETRVMWRRGSPAGSKEAEEMFLERARRYALLEKWNQLPPSATLPEFALDPATASFPDAARLAREVGKILDLGSRPAASLKSVLQEGFGVKLFFQELEGDESAAAAKGDFGCAVLMNAAQAPWRRNYNLAHEVFHLVTWEGTCQAWGGAEDEAHWLEHVEKLANAFASHLLLPADEVSSQFDARFPEGEIRYPDLVEMAREFEVSTEALVWRLRLLGRISQGRAEEILADPQFRKEDRRTMPHHWAPTPEGPLPDRYWRLALNAYRRGEVSLAKVAKLLEISVSQAGELLMGGEDEQEATPSPA